MFALSRSAQTNILMACEDNEQEGEYDCYGGEEGERNVRDGDDVGKGN